MSHDTFDCAAWVRRAKEFVRGLATLPGAIELNDAIEPPASANEHLREWMASPQCTVLPEVANMLMHGSQRCYLRFVWTPPPAWASEVRKVLSGSGQLVGGGDLCEAAAYSVYDHREFLKQLLPPAAPWQSEQDRQMFSERGDLFEILPNQGGGSIAIEMGDPQVIRPVVFVPPEENRARVKLSDGFFSFLTGWEALCYVRPQADNLHLWRSSQSSLVNVEWGRSLRELLRDAGARWPERLP